jgi:hypothetical protein
MTPDEQLQMRVRAVGITRSRRGAIICMAAATACFLASLYFYFSDNAFRALDASTPTPTEPAK